MNHSKPKLDFDSLAESLKTGIESYCDDAAERHIGIEEFVMDYLDLGVTPTQAQIALLKAFYGETLNTEQQSILECWKAEGRTNWQEGERYQNLILEAGRRSGKCLVGESWVLTEKGWETLAEIGNPVGATPDSKWTIGRNVYLPDGVTAAEYFYYLGESNTLKIKTIEGYEINGTPEHKIWCEEGGWKAFAEIKPGDKLAIVLGGQWEGTTMPLQEAYLLGVLCAGSFPHIENELRVDCRLRDVPYYRKKFRELNCTVSYQQGHHRQRKHLLMDKEVRERFLDLGYRATKPEDLEVPKPIRLGTREVQRAFLIGLIENSEGDGYEVVSRSRILLQQVQLLLLGFGIVSKIAVKVYHRRLHTYYSLTLNSSRDLELALHFLTLTSPSKSTEGIPKPPPVAIPKFEWVTVKEVEAGKGVCMDLHVPGKESYVAQGFLSHNTSMCASVIGAYEFFKLCRMRCPQEHYGIAKISTISILCLATQATQGQRTIFGGVKAVIQDCKYFRRLIEAQELFLLDEEIRYPRKRLAIYAGTSKSSSQVGSTLKALIMDEIARFENEKGINNALELWSNLGASTVTFGEEAIKVAISSAWCQGDAIQILLEKGKFTPHCLTFSLRSWDLNPVKASRDNPIIVAAYAEDPFKAALEFENIRPAVGDGFIPLGEIEAIPKRTAAVKLEPASVVIRGTTYRTVKCLGGEKSWCNTVLHIDPSMGKDGYGLAFGHNEFNEEGLQVVVIDGLALWQKQHDQPIYLADVEKVILEIHKLRNVVKVTGDHYGSGAETLQRLAQHGLRCEVVYFSNRRQVEMYELLRQLIHQRRLVLPGDNYWVGVLIRELSRVQLIRGSKIDHPPGANESKDLADAVAAVAWQLSQRLLLDGLGYKVDRDESEPQIKPVTPAGVDPERWARRQRYIDMRSERMQYAKNPY